LDVCSVVGEDADADTGGDRYLVLVEAERLLQRVEDAARHPRRVLAAGDFGEGDDELVPPEPGDGLPGPGRIAAGYGVAAPEALLQPFGDSLQEPVAEGVAEGVVDPLEPIDVEKENCERLALPPGAVERQPPPLREEPAVRPAAQPVVVGEEADLVLGLLAFRRVLRRP